MCVYVCMYICTYVCTCACAHVCVHARVSVGVYVHACQCVLERKREQCVHPDLTFRVMRVAEKSVCVLYSSQIKCSNFVICFYCVLQFIR